ncbi:MAG: ACP S-malonyltransferase [Chloroflexi bacterium]|nr:ACP S-malonyltransferase [Chloroflexota bacterium]
MGKALFEASQAARRVFQQADEVLGFSLSKLCFEGPAEELEDTVNAQPAILTVSIACLAALRERWDALGRSIMPVAVAGHSLGEFTALVAAGSIDFSDALRIVRERGRLMKETSESKPGGMAAVVGLDEATLRGICEEAQSGGVIVMANSNSPDQRVISGERAALERAVELARAHGGRAVILPISIASHSPLMQAAASVFAEILAKVPFRDPQVPIVANISGQIITSAEEIRRELHEHLLRPVEWLGSVRGMMEEGVTDFWEIGPGQVLTRLIKRISRDVQALNLSDAEIAKL